MAYKVLIVDDDEDDYLIARDFLGEIPDITFEVEWIDGFAKALDAIKRKEHDIYLFDYRLGAHSGLELLEAAKEYKCKAPVILLTGQGDHDIDMKAMKAGASDYLVKGRIDAALLGRSIRYAMERKMAEKQITTMAYYDSLTMLPNRTLFRNRLELAFIQAKRYNRKMAVLFLDLDNFKRINDTLGHEIGDLLIKETSERLLGCVRKCDTISRVSEEDLEDHGDHHISVARLGGDEFTILLTEIGELHDAARVAQRINEAISNSFSIAGNELHVSISIGIACYPLDEGCDTIDGIMKNADTAMYHAKEMGKNNYQFFKQSMNTVAIQRLVMESNLRRALEREEFILYYQPVIELASGRMIGVEALIRWQHPEIGMIAPDKFITLAEETGLILPMGEWVLKTACNQAMAWQAAGFAPLRMAVNISSVQFKKGDLTGTVAKALKHSGLPPHLLTLEITESVMMLKTADTITALQALKSMGVRIAIDDFGTGYSSLSYLKNFPIHTLKIDRSFVRDVMTNPEDAAIANVIIAMAKNLNFTVTAEGVETKEQLEFLFHQGCDEMQGYLVSPPVPAQELQTMLYYPGGETIIKPDVFASIHAGRLSNPGKRQRVEEEGHDTATHSGNIDRQVTILLADDDEDDRLMAKDALKEARLANDFHYVENGEELIDYLRHRGKYADPSLFPRPGLILLDLNMPKKDGREALREIKADEDLRRIPVVVLTTSKAEVDIFRTYDLGVNSFITKPVTFEGLVEVMKMLGKYWFQIVELPNGGIR